MSGATEMKVSLLLTLDNQLSPGLTVLDDALGKLFGVIEKLAGSFGGLDAKPDALFNVAPKVNSAIDHIGHFEGALRRLGDMAGTVGHHLDRMWGAAGRLGEKIGGFGGALAGFSVVEPVREYAGFHNILTHIASTEGFSGAAVGAEIARLTKMYAEDAQRTGQSSENIARAHYDLVQMNLKNVNLDTVLGVHSMAATAYNINPEALGHAVGALLNNFEIADKDLGPALSAMALASKRGLFKVEDFSLQLPGVAGFMNVLGMKGREGADYSFAALETIMKNSSEPNEAARGFVDALRYITDPAGKNAFRRLGIDLDAIELAGQRAGKNPMDSVLDYLTNVTKGMDPLRSAQTLGDYFHNQQAGLAILALMTHRQDDRSLKAELDKADPAMLLRDFNTALADPITQVRLFDENVSQITRTIGEGFVPGLQLIVRVLGDLKDFLGTLNEIFPVMAPLIEGAVASLLALGAAFGIISIVAGGTFAAIIATVGAIIVVATEIYEHWGGIKAFFTDLWWSVAAEIEQHWRGIETFFSDLWWSVMDTFHQWEDWLAGWIEGAMQSAINRIKTVWGGLKQWFLYLWKEITEPFDVLAGKINAVIDKLHLTNPVNPHAQHGPTPAGPDGPAMGNNKFHHSSFAAPAHADLFGRIVIEINNAGAAAVRGVTGNHPGLKWDLDDGNRVIGRA